ncbi:response regulator transcription factor [Paratissierella segnis]|jgi:two-component system response regulator YesN|uniref:Response regulator n=1 Tax=Paratissierella segnis TaxID=2763679 RepID=A0A926ESI6_9FIRM|nr:response regulator [Paratissierella segnis]MBC8587423.1 response regulator [Paratissierella segnis]
MIRVIIADDENRICMLIKRLIDWEKIGMLVVGMANNGLEAIELIEKENPDIVITDIRMPGYDGLELIEKAKAINKDLEFIIISGYGQFEYAKKAIGFGVKDYLLKPINQEELLNALLRVKGDIIREKGYINLENEYKLSHTNDRPIIRRSFLDNLITADGNNFISYTLEEINEKYYFSFKPYRFRIMILILDQINEDDKLDIRNIMVSALDTISSKLQDKVCDIEGIIKKNQAYILINYKEEENKIIEDRLLNILNDFNRTYKTNKFKLTLGYGEEVLKIGDIKASCESSKLSIDDRVIKGIGGLILYDEINDNKRVQSEKFVEFSKKFVKTVERLDLEGIKKSLIELKEEIRLSPISGRDLKVLILDIANIFDLTLKSNITKIESETKEYEKLENSVADCYSMDKLFTELMDYINSFFTLLDNDSTNRNLAQISQAKEYIEANYMNNITLEDVGNHIGFNPSYFSSIFKKETGSSFVEYLSKIRIEKAKVLLKESDLRVQDICLMVGYSDVKYFSKLFVKYTGLKPKDYRKIFI